MMASLRVFVCLLGLVVLCDSYCFFRGLEIKDLNNPPKGCVDMEGKMRNFGSEWVKDCNECSCTEEGMSCCSRIPNASTVNVPDECELLVDKEACTAKVVMKADKTRECNPN
ncbi:beta-microseminoprotein [Thunnus thynnus]|uniref:beta-microseminoprotein n=1 Tax=Thunnus thynnus TaxID=8237 RepID=UPI003526CFEB